MGKLYIISTPIGNLGDVTMRALKVLSDLEYIACENTNKIKILLNKYAINYKNKKLIPYNKFNESRKTAFLFNLLKKGQNLGLTSNAGTPLLQDPGYLLVRLCVREGISLVPIPGPSSLLAHVVCSGLPVNQFIFLGFLPKKKGKKLLLFKQLKSVSKNFSILTSCTVIFFESPHRLIQTLNLLMIVFGNIKISLGKELTKINESIKKEEITTFLNLYQKGSIKGELTICFNPQ